MHPNSTTISSISATAASSHNTGPESNRAIARCLQAWQSAFDAAHRQGQDKHDCEEAAAEAYKLALPPLDSYENIRDFIACITHGMFLSSFEFRDSKDYLFAAQVAVSALRAQPKPPALPGRPPKAQSVNQ